MGPLLRGPGWWRPALEPRTIAGLSLDFWTFWAGQAISTLGSSFTTFALPLLIFRLTGSAMNLSLSMAVSFLPNILFGLLIGAWVDRLDRKRLMLIVNLLFALAVSSIPVMAAAGHLTIWWIYAVQFVASTLRLFFGTASMAAVVKLVPHDRLVAANGRIQASYSTMSVVGPMLAGALSAFVPIASLILVDAVSYLVAALALMCVRGSFNAPEGMPVRRRVREDVAEGVRFVFAHPVLRNISLMMVLVNFVSLTVSAQLVYFARVQLHASSSQVGLLFSANAVGMLALSLVAGPLRNRLSFRWVALGALQMQGVVTILLGQLHWFWVAVPLVALWQGFGILFTINTTSLRQTVSPPHLLGRVVMTAGVLGGAVIPVGTLCGGFLIERTHDIGAVYTGIGLLVFLIPLVFSLTALGRAERYLPAEAQVQGTSVA